MRSSAKWILPVLMVLVTCLTVSVSAQKGKPAPPPPTWSVQISGANIYGPTEGLTGSDVVVLDVKVWGTPKNPRVIQPCNNCTAFNIEVKTPWHGESGPFIGFAGVELAAGTNPAGSPYEYITGAPTCTLPAFDESGVIRPELPGPTGPGCLQAFLSHIHPQAPYNRVMLSVMTAGDALSMSDGAILSSKGLVRTQVTGTDCYTTPLADQIYFAAYNFPDQPWPPSTGESVKVTRNGNTWTVEVLRATGLIDAHFTGPDPKFGGCGQDLTMTSFTNPLATTMTWTRK